MGSTATGAAPLSPVAAQYLRRLSDTSRRVETGRGDMADLIRKAHESGASLRQIAAAGNVSRETVRLVIKGKRDLVTRQHKTKAADTEE